MKWHFIEGIPIYTQIVQQFKDFIISGELTAGSRIPSVRDLAAAAGVNPNTMQRALSELEREGLIFSQRTAGKFITENEDFIELAKVKTAESRIRMFLKDMYVLGYNRQEIVRLVINFREDDDNE